LYSRNKDNSKGGIVNSVLDLGITINVFLQNLGDWLKVPMLFFSFMGGEVFYLVIAPLLYWCISPKLGLRVGMFLMANEVINYTLKVAFHAPRPYWYDSRVRALSTETSFGIPSGHAQRAVMSWGTLAAAIHRRWAWAVVMLLSFLIGLSRLYLGVHFLTDVLSGWLIGGLLLWAFLKVEKPILAWFGQQDLAHQVLAVFAGSLGLLLLGAVAHLTVVNWSIPPEWIQNSIQAGAHTLPDPLVPSGLITAAGVFFGMGGGAVLLNRRGGFNPKGMPLQLAGRYIVGLIGAFLIWGGLGAILPKSNDLLGYLFRYLRYTLVGAWISILGPVVFVWLKLAKGSDQ
jgi:membrane-associated phospholipid phosphatase